MNINDLRPAKDHAINFGVKAIIYGPAGSGKTPIINTAPRPILLACEPGLLSMRNSTVPTYAAFDAKMIDGFFEWFFGSNETKKFDTLCIDSTTEMAEIYLRQALKTNKHGLAAYGEMADNTLKHLQTLYFMREKHIYLIAKQDIMSNGGKQPYYPGKLLSVIMPHKFDQILHLDIHNVPNVGQVRSFQCAQTLDVLARDRTGMLGMFEQPDFGQVIKKVMM
jgi:hypothetical protein